MTQGGYLLLSTVAFFLTGAALFAADKKITVALRKTFHSWTSPETEPFPEHKKRGLVYGQPASRRFAVAGAISLIQTLLSVKNLSYNPLLELVTLLIETPIMVLGTYLGDRVLRFFGKAQPVFDAIDRIDAGESTVKGEARDIYQDLTGGGDQGEAQQDTPPPPTDRPAADKPRAEKPAGQTSKRRGARRDACPHGQRRARSARTDAQVHREVACDERINFVADRAQRGRPEERAGAKRAGED